MLVVVFGAGVGVGAGVGDGVGLIVAVGVGDGARLTVIDVTCWVLALGFGVDVGLLALDDVVGVGLDVCRRPTSV